MDATISRRPAPPAQTRKTLALAVADANWFTTENLFRETERDDVATLLLKCSDYLNALRRGAPPWTWRSPLVARSPRLWEHELILPSGWMKRFPRLGMRPIASAIRSWHTSQAQGAELALVMTYPHYLYLRDQVRPERSVYYNIDDYTLYWPAAAETIRQLERRAVLESDLTVCVARKRADELREAVPEASHKIQHLPHGAPSGSIAEVPWDRPAPPPSDLAQIPGPYLGYVGSLEDRFDWSLLLRLSEALPKASIILIGRTPAPGSPGMTDDCARCLARPNVHALGWRSQASIHLYNRAFDVCLIPYRTDHPFNVACCPTKIMDYMGSGRPIVATALPECRLYPHLFSVAESEEDFIEGTRTILASGSDDHRAPLRWAWARENTCQRVADRLLDWL